MANIQKQPFRCVKKQGTAREGCSVSVTKRARESAARHNHSSLLNLTCECEQTQPNESETLIWVVVPESAKIIEGYTKIKTEIFIVTCRFNK